MTHDRHEKSFNDNDETRKSLKLLLFINLYIKLYVKMYIKLLTCAMPWFI